MVLVFSQPFMKELLFSRVSSVEGKSIENRFQFVLFFLPSVKPFKAFLLQGQNGTVGTAVVLSTKANLRKLLH